LADRTTFFRWVQTYAAKPEKRVRRHLRFCTGSWRVDETYIKVKGVWTDLYRAVDSLGQTIDFGCPPVGRQRPPSASFARRWLSRIPATRAPSPYAKARPTRALRLI